LSSRSLPEQQQQQQQQYKLQQKIFLEIPAERLIYTVGLSAKVNTGM